MESATFAEQDENSTSKSAKVSVTDLSLSEYTTLITSKTVTLIVGPKRKSYPVHKNLLCYCSDYFAKAFNGSFQEAKKDEIYLTEENPAAVELFISWLYRGAGVLVATETSLATLLELYITADKWCLQAVQDAVVISTRTWFDKNPEKGFKSLECLVGKYYGLLQVLQDRQYRHLLNFYAIELHLSGKGNIDDFFRSILSHDGFAIETAVLQMQLLSRNNVEGKKNLIYLRDHFKTLE
ncbi:hypothetical protein MMC17_004515 [Xylographa soralifera]|nr:hypothetical protein [Xylographa soralifera]